MVLLAASRVPFPASALALQQRPPQPQSIAEATRGFEKRDGFFPLYWDAQAGELFLELGVFDAELLYQTSLPAGLGSNDIGLDRGQLGGTHVVRFHRVGPKVLMIEPNYAYRADSDNPAERRAVDDAFASSVLWGFKVVAEEGGRVLVNATDFALRDAHDVIGTLKRMGQGSYRPELSRSAVYLPRTKGFPQNTEIEVTLTFVGDDPGTWVRDVAPTPEAITVRQHHSFVELPEPHAPRTSDPGAGFFGITYLDYAAPLGQPLARRFIARHRLKKREPAAPVSEPVEPIVYYLDRGTPEPIRSALLEGARWWNQAFEAAGYWDAFLVELMPEDADPMDLRYNVIQWVHRATRGWSYGSSVIDPRTGEILKGHVTLGSLRVRQDHLIAEGLLSPYETGEETPPALAAMALARIRQLAAHEVGHTLGLAHNYIASAEGPDGRASVMDYPHPLVQLREDGSIDLANAYDTGIGEWDKVAIAYGYQDFPGGTDADAALDSILTEARARGITFLTDQDARPAGSAHPLVHLWDNGRDAVAELERVMRVRRSALDRFGETAIRNGMPLATLEEVLVPLYLHHRYQVEAAAKVLGGQAYTYALRGDGQEPLRPVPAAQQRHSLEALLRTLDPAELALPTRVLERLPPRPFTFPAHRELFSRYTGLTFDAVAPAVAAADLTVSMIFQPERAARLVEQHALHGELPGLGEVIDRVLDRAFQPAAPEGYLAEIGRAVQRLLVDRLMELARDAEMPQVRAVAAYKLQPLAGRALAAAARANDDDRAHFALLAADIGRFLERPGEPARARKPLPAPPGSPIGDAPAALLPDLKCEGW
ncbi:MAG: zinc-dependent metalloprotease [Gemmatimonadetes bacterium]|nr:zinc-dependent metalloprotease [Gemmatimonadota bacterium]